MRWRFRFRRIVLGLAVGLLAGLPLTATLGHPVLAMALGALCGAVYSLAIRVRNAVIAAFDAADAEPDPDKRRARLTIVIAGGGFSGAELAGALNDFARGMPCAATAQLWVGNSLTECVYADRPGRPPRHSGSFPSAWVCCRRSCWAETLGVKLLSWSPALLKPAERSKIAQGFSPGWAAALLGSPAGTADP